VGYAASAKVPVKERVFVPVKERLVPARAPVITLTFKFAVNVVDLIF